jgi:hypothetical protein
LILDLGQPLLQLEKILVGLELRIGLGDREQPSERPLQGPLGCVTINPSAMATTPPPGSRPRAIMAASISPSP